MKKVITPVGTSIFKNYEEESNKLKITLQVLKGEKAENWDKLLGTRITPVQNELISWAEDNKDASAEIKSLWKIYEQVNEDLEVYLICTETILSRLAADIITQYFNNRPGSPITVHFDYEREDRIKGLQVEDRKRFEQEGIVNLVKRFSEITGGYTENVIMNVTGGYKGVIPYLSILSQINNVPIYYIFEDTEELIRIPQAPINLDKGLFEKYHLRFQELYDGIIESWEDYRRKNNIGDDFKNCITEDIIDGENIIYLNGIGTMLWVEYNSKYDIVYFPYKGKYSKEEQTKKKHLEEAIIELLRRLREINDFSGIKNNGDLNHLNDKEPYVYKHTNPQQIRIQYWYDIKSNKLVIYNYYFITDDTIDKNYPRKLKEEYENLKDRELISVAISR
ncbi:hypothetical protein [Dehalobacterium formicoaceticum]|uniref:CRISPR system ring nuclease SSO1393-like domain-containing protein n=1 Tax=Dehalobacterium formicoaceticum TaxID=51515 RepID=A0ABT1Y479_9FIRM|nr:hypothetical protein [Dehalobacterium formicoaceticum]MCR6544719.1 hypothetical protein [Dehalobacterium formicoaceticum]